MYIALDTETCHSQNPTANLPKVSKGQQDCQVNPY